MDYSTESMVFYYNNRTIHVWLEEGEWLYRQEDD